MSKFEQPPRSEEMSDFDMELDMGEFDINAAFQEAIAGVASDTELALDEKVRRMEVIVSEGKSEVYRDFVDFRQMAAQMEMMCNHNHAFSQSIQGNETLSGFMDLYQFDDEHDHDDDDEDNEDDDEYVIDPKTGKKTKKRYNWFSLL